VAEESGRDDHARVVSAFIDLEIGAAGQSDLDFDKHLTTAGMRDRHFLNLHVLFAVEDGGCHFPVHFYLLLPG
jgi:hypothetical protein